MKNIIKILVLSVLFTACTESQTKQTTKSEDIDLIKMLDANNDGNLNPYEALDVLLQLKKEHKDKLTIEDFKKIETDYKKESETEILEMFNSVDTNSNGKIELSEIDKKDDFMQYMMSEADANNDKVVTLAEMKNFDFGDSVLASKEEVKERADELFKEYEGNTIELTKVDKELLGRFTEWDENRDGKVTKEEALNYMMADNIPVEFTVKGTTAYMRGVITDKIPAKVLQLIFEHPEVATIEMTIVPGSIADDANMHACHYVYDHGLTTKLNSRSSVASGGTDFFLAGKKRIVEKGATLGVHSWGGGDVAATEVPKDDPVHKKYIEMYEKTGVPASFYWYTLEAAPADDIHIMTEEEIEKYKVRTN